MQLVAVSSSNKPPVAFCPSTYRTTSRMSGYLLPLAIAWAGIFFDPKNVEHNSSSRRAISSIRSDD